MRFPWRALWSVLERFRAASYALALHELAFGRLSNPATLPPVSPSDPVRWAYITTFRRPYQGPIRSLLSCRSGNEKALAFLGKPSYNAPIATRGAIEETQAYPVGSCHQATRIATKGRPEAFRAIKGTGTILGAFGGPCRLRRAVWGTPEVSAG